LEHSTIKKNSHGMRLIRPHTQHKKKTEHTHLKSQHH